MGRPVKDGKNDWSRYPLRVESKKWKRFDCIARAQDKSIAAALDEAIDDYIARNKQALIEQMKSDLEELMEI